MKKIIFFTVVLIWSFGMLVRTVIAETNSSSIADIDCVQYTKSVAIDATSDSSPNNISMVFSGKTPRHCESDNVFIGGDNTGVIGGDPIYPDDGYGSNPYSPYGW